MVKKTIHLFLFLATTSSLVWIAEVAACNIDKQKRCYGYNWKKIRIQNIEKEYVSSKNISNMLYLAAKWNKYPEVIAKLSALGATVNISNVQANAPIHIAAKFNPHPEIIVKLVELGALLGVENKDGDTPVYMAARSNENPEVMLKLIALNNAADIDAKNKAGNALLHLAAENKISNTVIALIQLGADIEVRNNVARTPLHEAARLNKNPGVVTALINAGANIDVKDKYGKIPFDYAKDNKALKHTEAYWLLILKKNAN